MGKTLANHSADGGRDLLKQFVNIKAGDQGLADVQQGLEPRAFLAETFRHERIFKN
jgi:hypothetical protein